MFTVRGLSRTYVRGFISLGLILLLIIGFAVVVGTGWWATRNVPTTLNQAPNETASTTPSGGFSLGPLGNLPGCLMVWGALTITTSTDITGWHIKSLGTGEIYTIAPVSIDYSIKGVKPTALPKPKNIILYPSEGVFLGICLGGSATQNEEGAIQYRVYTGSKNTWKADHDTVELLDQNSSIVATYSY